MSEPDYPTVDKVKARLARVLDRWGDIHTSADATAEAEAARRASAAGPDEVTIPD